MDVDQLAEALAAHKADNERQFAELHKGLKMTEHVKNIFNAEPAGAGMMGGWGGAGAGAGAGLGAGLLGGILGGVLLNRNGLFGGGEGGNHVTPAQLSSAINGVTDNNNVTTILQSLGDIKAAVPLAEGQVQLALAQTQNALSSQASGYAIGNVQGFANVNDNVARSTAAVIAVGETIKDTVNTTSAATQLGIANLATAGLQNTYAITQAINADGEKTRALLVAQNEATLQRQLAVAEAALAEQRAEGRARGTEVNVTQTVNQNQMQLQAQQQQQQQAILLNQLLYAVGGLQNAVATNSNLIVGNTGAVATGPQTANPVNVRT